MLKLVMQPVVLALQFLWIETAIGIVGQAAALAAPSPSPSPASSAVPTPASVPSSASIQDHLDVMLKSGHADAQWFAANFLDQISTSKIDDIVASLTRALGKYQYLENATPYVAHFEHGTDAIEVHLDPENRIDGLLFKPPVRVDVSLSDAERVLANAGPKSFIIVKDDGTLLAGLDVVKELNVASAFKLAEFNALHDVIEHHVLKWNDVLYLKERWRSLPSGVMQDWPVGTPVTVATLATEMISASDNTAADALIDTLGFKALAPYAASNVPFLTTRQTFILRSSGAEALLSSYIAAETQKDRADVLERVDHTKLPTTLEVSSLPENIGWRYSVRDLCKMMKRIADDPILQINPGLADASSFRQVSFKGGTDRGVLNLTTEVVTERGTRLCISATWNDATASIDEEAARASYESVLQQLERE